MCYTIERAKNKLQNDTKLLHLYKFVLLYLKTVILACVRENSGNIM